VRELVSTEARTQNIYGMTALMCATENGKTECVKILAPLEAGMQRNDRRTALILAVERDNLECI